MIVIKNKVVVCLLFFSLLLTYQLQHTSFCLALSDNQEKPVIVVQKVELLAVISLLSEVDDYFACDRLNTVIKRDVVAWFRPFKNHQAVKTYITLINQDQTESSLRKFLMELGDLPDLSIPDNLPNEFMDEKFYSFRTGLVSFCQDSNFLTFWCRENEYYDQMVDEFSMDCTVIESLNQEYGFLGISDFTCSFVLSPLMMENQVILPDSLSQNTGLIIVGLSDIQNGRLLFGTNKTHLSLVQKDLLELLTAKVTKQYAKDISKSKSLLAPIQEKMETYQIMSWEDCFNHHLSLSIQLLCFENNQPEKLEELKKKGFIYINDTYDLLKQYGQYRTYYPTLKTFLPRILDQFDAIARRN